jgi:hypothetical protein
MSLVTVHSTVTVKPWLNGTGTPFITITKTQAGLLSGSSTTVTITAKQTTKTNGTAIIQTITSQVAVTYVPGPSDVVGADSGAAASAPVYVWAATGAAALAGLLLPLFTLI